MKTEALIEFLTDSRIYILRKLERALIDMEEYTKIIEARDSISIKIGYDAIYDKKQSKEAKKYWKLNNDSKKDRGQSHSKIEECIMFAREIDHMVINTKQKALLNSLFLDVIKKAIVETMRISYPKKYTGFEKYCFKTSSDNFRWLGFEWIYGRTSLIPNVKKRMDIKRSGWYIDKKYYCY